MKKILVLLIVTVLVVCIFPVSVFAGDERLGCNYGTPVGVVVETTEESFDIPI